MRSTAVFAVVLATVLLSMGNTQVSAQELTSSKQTNFVNNVLLATTVGDQKEQAKAGQTSDNTASETAEKPAEAETAPAQPAAPQPVIVTVQAGDSLSSIATAHSTTWVRLYNANTGVVDPNIINPGQQLRIPETNEQLQDRALPQPQPVVTQTTTTTATRTTSTATRSTASPRTTQATTSYPVSANAAKAFIYAHESGNNPNATNPNGCYGLGQDCNGRVRSLCGADYACQDAFFTRYAMARYGSWEGAYAFWQSHHWW